MERSLGFGSVCCAVAMAWAGQGLAQTPKDWRTFEADPRTNDFRNKLRENTFNEDSRAFLADIALPQLELPANRDTIDRVRRRIREWLAADPSLPTIVGYATTVARDETKPLVVRVNAMLLLAELEGRDRRPWPGAAQPLVSALGDTALPPAVRVAAAAGLSRHMAVAGKALAASAGPVLIQAARADAATVDPVAANWLAGRAFTMLAMLGADAPAETVEVASAIVADEERPLDLRVRAAVALGAIAAEGRAIDAATALRSIGDLAVAVVREARDLSKQSAPPAGMAFGGGGYGDPTMGGLPDPAMLGGSAPPGIPPGAGGMGGPFGGTPEGYAMNPSGMPMPENEGLQLAFRRSAWRLAKLADAVGTDDGKAGLILVTGPLQPKALQMSGTLRNAATSIDATPSGATIEKAYQVLTAAGAANKPAGAAEPAKTAPGASPKPAGAQGAAAPNAAQPAPEVNPFAQ